MPFCGLLGIESGNDSELVSLVLNLRTIRLCVSHMDIYQTGPIGGESYNLVYIQAGDEQKATFWTHYGH